MVVNRFFTDQSLEEGKELFLDEEESRHLRVIRANVGDKVEVVNGKNELGLAACLQATKKEARFLIEKVEKFPPPSPKIFLFQALCRLNHLDILLEKGCELGMSNLFLFPGERSEKQELSSHQLERSRRILISAMKQCGRLDLPQIHIIEPIASWKKNDLFFPAYFGHLEKNAPRLFDCIHQEDQFSFITGPEAGFSDNEIQTLLSLGAKGVRLHPNILRTETAPLVALSLISHFSM